MESAVNDTDTSRFEPHSKRRKLRKGTTSCWDCKKRKVKCTFDATSDTICVTCRRRNAPCVRQDQPDEVLDDSSQPLASLERSDGSNKTYPTPGLSYEQLLERLRRAETLLAQSEDSRHDPASSYVQLPTPSSAALTPEHGLLEAEDSGNISISLRQTFPPQRDLDLLCRSNRSATLYSYKCLTRPSNLLEDESFDIVDELATVPDASTTPPVVVARHMLILALMLQYFRCNGVDRLSGDPNALAVRMVDAAVRLVIANDQLVGCIEGLECIIYEAMFQSNAGNLRRAWIAFRRAMIFAQLMRLDSPNPPPVKLLENKHRVNTKFLWSRIVHMDSYLSLMLGLPHGGQTTNMEISIPGETLSDRIDRAHTLIARGIVERNRGDPRQNIEATRKLDIDLQNVTKSLPDKYWLAPSFTRLQQSTKEASEELMRLRDQLYQYNLLHLLHLPFLIHCGKESDYHMYAKITCINAARDVLTRFVAYQNFRPISAQSSHTADFFALMAGMTILIAHIDSCHWQNNNFLVHQRPGDRAMIEQLVEKLEHVAAQSNESLTGKSAEQLRSLLEIEGDAARGSRHTGESAVDRLEEGCGEQFQLSIPYFGIIKICVKGITREQPDQLAPDADMPAVLSSLNPMAAYDNVFSAFGQDINDNASSDFLAAQPNAQNFQTLQSGVTSSEAIFNTPQHYPGLAAGTNDWAFQGVDAAFFDSLMRGVGDWEDTTGDLIVSTDDHI